jgi:hypothetical protein
MANSKPAAGAKATPFEVTVDPQTKKCDPDPRVLKPGESVKWTCSRDIEIDFRDDRPFGRSKFAKDDIATASDTEGTFTPKIRFVNEPVGQAAETGTVIIRRPFP